MELKNQNNHSLTHEQIKNVEKWIAALRSGNFKQGQYVLCEVGESENKYCCLGVACELFKDELHLRVEEELYTTPFGPRRNVKAYNRVKIALPESVKNFLGLASWNGKVSEHSSLAAMNDEGVSFEKIANIIELNLKSNRRLFL